MQASAEFHDAGACSSIPPYYSERRPSYPPRWVQELTNPHQSSEYRATIARLSNDFLANASSLFGGSPSRTRSAPTTLTGPAAPRSSPIRTGDFIPARKRSLEVMSEEPFIEQVPAPFTRYYNSRSDDLTFSNLALVLIQHPRKIPYSFLSLTRLSLLKTMLRTSAGAHCTAGSLETPCGLPLTLSDCRCRQIHCCYVMKDGQCPTSPTRGPIVPRRSSAFPILPRVPQRGRRQGIL
jgi:hypothetical protein